MVRVLPDYQLHDINMRHIEVLPNGYAIAEDVGRGAIAEDGCGYRLHAGSYFAGYIRREQPDWTAVIWSPAFARRYKTKKRAFDNWRKCALQLPWPGNPTNVPTCTRFYLFTDLDPVFQAWLARRAVETGLIPQREYYY